MSDQTAQEPTMEEILASIRRIISEDDAPAADAPAAAAAPVEPEPEAEEDDVLELTHAVEEPAPLETHGDLDVYDPPAAPPEPEPEPVRAVEPEPVYIPEPEPAYTPSPAPVASEGLVSAVTATATASAFGALTAHVSMPAPGRSLEDVVQEMLKPLLKDWLDANLTRIVEAKVAEEVERIRRGRVG